MVAYFDTTLEAPRIEEQQSTPILPEDRFVFELIGFERSQPDQWRKDGGIKWTFRVFNMDGSPFLFQDEQYEMWRTTGLTRDGRPNFNLGTYGNDWASALLGRELGVDANFSVSELRNRRMSAMVVWENQRSDPKKKTIKLASLRHVPVGGATNGRAVTAPPLHPAEQIAADASDEDIDRALAVTKIQKSLARLKKLDETAGAAAQKAVDDSDLDDASLDALTTLSDQISAAVMKAMND